MYNYNQLQLPSNHSTISLQPYKAASRPTMATLSPRPAPADWKGAAAVLAAGAALPDAEADEAEAEAEAAEADDCEAVADAEDEADEPEGQLGLVLRSTPEPLHRAVARVIVPGSMPSATQRRQDAALLTVNVGLVAAAQDTARDLRDGLALADAANIDRATRAHVAAVAVLGTLGEARLESLRKDGGAESSNSGEDREAHDDGGVGWRWGRSGGRRGRRWARRHERGEQTLCS